MKFIARLVYEIQDARLVELEEFHQVWVTGSITHTKIHEISTTALDHLMNVLDLDRLKVGHSICLFLAGDLEGRVLPRHEDWYHYPKIEWSALEILSIGSNGIQLADLPQHPLPLE